MNKTANRLLFTACAIFILNPPLAFADSTFKSIKELESQEKSVNEKISAADELLKKPKLEYTASDLKDPFFPEEKKPETTLQPDTGEITTEVKPVPEGQLESLSNFTVTGIIWGGTVAQAIVNDKVVKIGDIVDGAKIIKIEKNGIIVSYMNRQYKLTSPADNMMQSIQKEPKGGQ
ncbi:MAG: hypothetical protein PHN57_05325 [Candidatus Omnitrophica bacterium]|nr:hypothetical protein [Candidatus Omnitrophota bacterium]